MPSIMQWFIGIVAGFLVLQFGSRLVPSGSPGGAVALGILAAVVVTALWVGWKAAHMGGS